MIFHLIIYFLLFCGVVTLNVVNNGYLPFILDVIFVSVSFILFITVIIQRHFVSARFESDLTTVERGNKASVKVIVTNKGFLPITCCKLYVEFAHNKKKRVFRNLVFIAPHSETTVEILADCKNCECIKMNIGRIYVYDYLKVFELSKKNQTQANLLVLPASPTIDFITSTSFTITNEENVIYSDKKPGDDPTEIFSIREFMAGDKIRNIHWKVSSKVGQYMVKDYGLPIFEDDTIVFEWVKTKDKDLKKIKNQTYDILFGLMTSILRRGMGFNVCYVSDMYHQLRINNMSEVYNLFFELYSKEKGTESASEIYFSAHDNNSNRVIFVSNEYNDETINKLKLLSEIGPVFYLIPRKKEEQEALKVFTS